MRKRKNITPIVILILIIALFVYVFYTGKSLERSDELENADIIVVLMGIIPERILEASDLYSEGYSDKIVMVNEYQSDMIKEFDIQTPMSAYINKEVAIEMGVNASDIIVIDGQTQSTQDEAVVIRDYVEENDISSIILVTSKSHSLRAAKIFEKALGDDVKVISAPTKYDEFNADKWWKSREDIEQVVFETIKLLNFYVIEQFKLGNN